MHSFIPPATCGPASGPSGLLPSQLGGLLESPPGLCSCDPRPSPRTGERFLSLLPGAPGRAHRSLHLDYSRGACPSCHPLQLLRSDVEASVPSPVRSTSFHGAPADRRSGLGRASRADVPGAEGRGLSVSGGSGGCPGRQSRARPRARSSGWGGGDSGQQVGAGRARESSHRLSPGAATVCEGSQPDGHWGRATDA